MLLLNHRYYKSNLIFFFKELEEEKKKSAAALAVTNKSQLPTNKTRANTDAHMHRIRTDLANCWLIKTSDLSPGNIP